MNPRLAGTTMQSSPRAKPLLSHLFQGDLRRFGMLTIVLGRVVLLDAQDLAKSGPQNAPIPMDQLGAVAGKQYQGDGLAVTATAEGARLRCRFQRLEGHATPEGLWLASTAKDATGERFRVVAAAVGRDGAEPSTLNPQLSTLPPTGKVTVAEQVARLIRPGLTEEYTVSMDGVRQDFVIAERPAGAGDLCVELALSGARAEAAAYGAKLTLAGPGRTLAYNRLRVADATGQELSARLEVLSADRLAMRVADASATYPVRIDPTFSDADWVRYNPSMPGASGDVRALVADGLGNIYASGDFAFIGTEPASRIAKWDGSKWSAFGSGMNGTVYALAMLGTNLYAGGQFTTAGGVPANNIAKWDGSTWSALGSGMDIWVQSLAVIGTNLYAGGAFTTAGGVQAKRIAKWNGSAWSTLGGGMDNLVYSLAVMGNDLYAGGVFATAGGVAANRIAKWNGSAWSALGSGSQGSVNALAVSGTSLYAAGGPFLAAGAWAYGIAEWNGSAWTALGSGVGGDIFGPTISSLAVNGSDVYVGGFFTTAGGFPATNIAKWNGITWSALGLGMDANVLALAKSGNHLYAGGSFTAAGGMTANYIAQWDGSAWSTFGSGTIVFGMNGLVNALAVSGTNLYAGGVFTTAGGVAATNIAQWNGSALSALGSGVNDSIYVLAVRGTELYAGGGGIYAWNGSTWSVLAPRAQFSSVTALAASGTTLYASIYNAFASGGGGCNQVGQWDGSLWSSLGPGLGCGGANTFLASGTNLYAGGQFTTADGLNYIAKWDGITWSAFGSGMSGGSPYIATGVNALAMVGTNLYAGGNFYTAGGVSANGIAKWDGSAWSALGSGVSGGLYPTVFAMAVHGTDLYVGGTFTTAGEVAANYIAKWDGSTWSALGSGMNGGEVYPATAVNALAVIGNSLYAAGNFTVAGTNLAPFIAQANIGPGVTGGQFGSLTYSPLTGFSSTFSDGTIGQPYHIQTSPSLTPASWTDLTNFTYNGPIVITDTSTATNKFYRAVAP